MTLKVGRLLAHKQQCLVYRDSVHWEIFNRLVMCAYLLVFGGKKRCPGVLQ